MLVQSAMHCMIMQLHSQPISLHKSCISLHSCAAAGSAHADTVMPCVRYPYHAGDKTVVLTQPGLCSCIRTVVCTPHADTIMQHRTVKQLQSHADMIKQAMKQSYALRMLTQSCSHPLASSKTLMRSSHQRNTAGHAISAARSCAAAAAVPLLQESMGNAFHTT